jgi:hypothetical protein
VEGLESETGAEVWAELAWPTVQERSMWCPGREDGTRHAAPHPASALVMGTFPSGNPQMDRGLY